MGTKLKNESRQDVVVILSSNQSADIAAIHDYTEEAILASSIESDYCLPLADLQCYVGPNGKVYTYKAIEENIIETKNLAALEKSIVLTQITNYNEQSIEEKSKLSIRELILYIILGILLLAVVFK